MTLAEQIAYLARHGGVQPSETIALSPELRVEVCETLRVLMEREIEDAADVAIGQGAPVSEPVPVHPDVEWFMRDPARIERCRGMYVAVKDQQVFRMDYVEPAESVREKFESHGGVIFFVRPEERQGA